MLKRINTTGQYKRTCEVSIMFDEFPVIRIVANFEDHNCTDSYEFTVYRDTTGWIDYRSIDDFYSDNEAKYAAALADEPRYSTTMIVDIIRKAFKEYGFYLSEKELLKTFDDVIANEHGA